MATDARRAHHWACDAGLFTLASDYTVVVSPLVQRAESRKFEMLSLAGQRMHIP
jgi:predicted restriction endonuclease